ncbi:hypothetical protein BC938DRAFT_479941 [Jimgerdemannia flammicorona]|uniref:factor independent urate hydroxylase n=1 Tax=Jimgerdemannia flammicorona TaxID=994334 RepID=A0A433QJR3_9FUNG|nr:hypothetical protein BC938DRAFT_479941 [Jimgerdemannia flammicorona]
MAKGMVAILGNNGEKYNKAITRLSSCVTARVRKNHGSLLKRATPFSFFPPRLFDTPYTYPPQTRLTSMPETFLKAAAYGKDRVRLLKVYREGKWQTAVELTVRVMLEGDIETSYTRADNSVVVATDTMKNTVYIIAKRSPNVNIIELFAQELSQHFLDTYAHIHKVQISIIKHKWTRILVSGSPHPHSFVRDGDDLQTTTLTQTRKGNAVTCTSGLQSLLVLKTTGSAFHSFIRDKYTTLPDVWDRIFSTSVDATWTFKHSDVKKFRAVPFDAVHAGVREITLDTFATDDSASVQATLFKMQQRILERYGDVEEVGYALPNKHYFGVDMSKFGIDNTNKKLDVYQPVADPSAGGFRHHQNKSLFGGIYLLLLLLACESAVAKPLIKTHLGLPIFALGCLQRSPLRVYRNALFGLHRPGTSEPLADHVSPHAPGFQAAVDGDLTVTWCPGLGIR